jgi:hypothetical protein
MAWCKYCGKHFQEEEGVDYADTCDDCYEDIAHESFYSQMLAEESYSDADQGL